MASLFAELQSKVAGERKLVLRAVPDEDRHDRSSANLALSGDDVLADEAARWEYFFNSGVTSWHSLIEAHTFSSSFCTLTRKEAQVIVDHWDACRRIVITSPNIGSEQEALLAAQDEKTRSQLSELAKRLETAIQAEIGRSPVQLAFVKLSTRSPKDSKKALKRAEATFCRKIAALSEEDRVIDDNQKWQILSDAVTRATAVANADQAMELLLDSDRVYEDLEYALRGPEGASADGQTDVDGMSRKWNMAIVARAWDPRLTPESEFRGICWGGKLTCLCQYFHPLFFPSIVTEKAAIQRDILAKFEHQDIQAAVASLGGNCIIDFARLAANDVLVIELNPFDGVCLGTFPASTGLFIWDDEVDQQIMRGNAPFQFRIRSAPLERHLLLSQCNPEWRRIIYRETDTM